MCTPTSICLPQSSTWMASSRSRAVAGSMVKMRFLRRSSRFVTSRSKSSFACITTPSTSSNIPSSKSTSWQSNPCSISACFSSASRSPACPKHWPLSLPRGSDAFSSHVTIWTGHSWNLSRGPGMFNTLRVTSLIFSRIHGMRASVGFAFINLSVSFTSCECPSAEVPTSFGWRVHTMTRSEPFLSAMATTLASFGRSRLRPRLDEAAPAAAVSGSCAATNGPEKTTSSSESESGRARPGGARKGSSPSSSSSRMLCASSLSGSSSQTTTSPWTARFLHFFPMTARSCSLGLKPVGTTWAVLSLAPLQRRVPLTNLPEATPSFQVASSR
mmetsp:Transcript_75207/g.210131  ORF Transcript_75207/g.210131 Transcript_75207/m.210131 type:complete len:329 (-) Transcript_75207:89-1075(-)